MIRDHYVKLRWTTYKIWILKIKCNELKKLKKNNMATEECNPHIVFIHTEYACIPSKLKGQYRHTVWLHYHIKCVLMT